MTDSLPKYYVYDGFGPTLDFAESLGWVDKFSDGSDSDYCPEMADEIEQSALDFISDQGYRIV